MLENLLELCACAREQENATGIFVMGDEFESDEIPQDLLCRWLGTPRPFRLDGKYDFAALVVNDEVDLRPPAGTFLNRRE